MASEALTVGAGAPDPDGVHDLAGLAVEIDRLRRWAARGSGKSRLSLLDITRMLEVPRSTLHNYLTGKTLPPADILDALVIALGADAGEQRAWAEAWHRVCDDIDRQRRSAECSSGPHRASATDTAVPRQLPPDVAGFTGREHELRALDEVCEAARAEGRVAIGVVSGLAGVGKTTLVVHWAHRAAARFPDGQLFVDLHGFGPSASTMGPDEVVRGFLHALGVAPRDVPPSVGAQTAMYRTLLSNRRMVVLLDNARDVAQVRPLLIGAPGCVVIVTSRGSLAGLISAEGARPLVLDLMSAQDARGLLGRRIGSARVAAEPGAADDIIAACARLPLALVVVASRAATHPRFPLEALAEELRDSQARLDALTGDDPASDMRSVFSWSYQALTPGAATLFRLLALPAGPDITVAAVASLLGSTRPPAARMLAELAQANLVAEPLPGRYVLHDLLRVYAADLAISLDSDTLRRAAMDRIVDHYLHSALAASRLLDPHQVPIDVAPPSPGTAPETFPDRRAALTWFTAEHHVLLATIERAALARDDARVWQLGCALASYLLRRGHGHDQATVQRKALAAAQRLADPPAQARAHRNLGRAQVQLGRLTIAARHLRRALALSVQAGDEVGAASAHIDLGIVAGKQGSFVEALGHEESALRLLCATESRLELARTLNNLGWIHIELGDPQRALDTCRQALAMHQELGNRYGEAAAWDSIGLAHHKLGHHERAISCYRRALALDWDLPNEASTLTHLADAYQAAGDIAAADAARKDAATILDSLDRSQTNHVQANGRRDS